MMMTAVDFAGQGFATLPVFDPDRIMAARQDIADQIDRVASALYLPFADSAPDAPLPDRLDQVAARERSVANLLRVAVCTDAHRGPRIASLATDPTLIETASRLAGRPLDGTIARVRASIGAFPEHRHAWHSDVALDDGSECARVTITAWIPLGDATPADGGLEVVAGRRDTPFPHARDTGFAIPEDSLVGLPRARPFCPAGTALFLDRFTPHRTLPVASGARFALVVWFKAALGQ